MTDSRICPACGGDLALTTHNDMEIDICVQCHGLWLDKGELERLMGKSDAPDDPDHVPAPPVYNHDRVLARDFRLTA